jgi:hypothetical protein
LRFQLIGRYDEINHVAPAGAPFVPTSRLVSAPTDISTWHPLGRWLSHVEEARHALAEAQRNWPFTTVRSSGPADPSTKIFQAQIANYREGLRLAGLRDHAEEDADFGVAPDAGLREARRMHSKNHTRSDHNPDSRA